MLPLRSGPPGRTHGQIGTAAAPQQWPIGSNGAARRRPRVASPQPPRAFAELAAAVDAAANAAGPLAPLVSTLGRDALDVAALQPTGGGLARLGGLAYLLLASPNPLVGLIDFYLLGPATAATATKLKARDFVVREKLGGGNFGVTYEAVRLKGGTEAVSPRGALTSDQKARRVVLKRVNLDPEGVRRGFLRAGTMAKGAAETGAVESYMCAKVKRNPLVAACCAEYLGAFTADEASGTIQAGTQWLAWRFESDCTLADGLDGLLGAFPEAFEDLMLGRIDEGRDILVREAEVIRAIIRQVLVGLKRLHSLGIVHRDIKPENLLITADGKVKLIDFGAAADMSTGINFNPLYGMLDPRYSPPEELIMPQNFPRAPIPLLACLTAPLAWAYGRPDLFDSYSVGVLLMQMAVPQLRSSASIRQFNSQLANLDHDLEAWRSRLGRGMDFSQLDRANGAGWDLATRLLAKRNALNRGRMSVEEALGHRYLSPGLFGER